MLFPWPIDNGVDGAMVERVGALLSASSGVIRGENTANKANHDETGRAIVADHVGIPPGVAALRAFGVEVMIEGLAVFFVKRLERVCHRWFPRHRWLTQSTVVSILPDTISDNKL